MLVFSGNQSVELLTPQEFENFTKDYRIIEAAGGIVFNNQNEVLMIYRLNRWDFPKGKVEFGEICQRTAVREVQEETGIRGLKVGDSLPITYHTYELHEEKILKMTYWFKMDAPKQHLTPQKEEDITQAVWVPFSEVNEKLENSYSSLMWLWKSVLKESTE